MKPEQYPYSLLPSGHGHYSYLIQFRGKEYKTVTNNMMAIDDFRADDDERRWGRNRRLMGAINLRNEAIRTHNLR